MYAKYRTSGNTACMPDIWWFHFTFETTLQSFLISKNTTAFHWSILAEIWQTHYSAKTPEKILLNFSFLTTFKFSTHARTSSMPNFEVHCCDSSKPEGARRSNYVHSAWNFSTVGFFWCPAICSGINWISHTRSTYKRLFFGIRIEALALGILPLILLNIPEVR